MTEAMDKFDICIAGAGVLGLAVAYQLSCSSTHKNKSIVIVDKENSFGQITSSRNSEVIHAGIYYASNSLKALFCVAGKRLLYEHLEKFNLPYKKTGKLIIAQENEIDALYNIEKKAIENHVTDLRFITGGELRKVEPNLKATAALLSPTTGIFDSHAYMQRLLHLAAQNGVTFSPYTEIRAVGLNTGSFKVAASLNHKENEQSYEFECDQFINCAGLDAQKLARQIEGVKKSSIPELHPCKGDYFAYTGVSPFHHLIYPIPEKNHTGLGIHSTLDIGGQTRFGPDTTYVDKLNYDINPNKKVKFLNAIRRYFPAAEEGRLHPAYSGIRPKIVGPGEAAGDFKIHDAQVHGVPGLIQFFGMESPALTASLAIGNHVVKLLN